MIERDDPEATEDEEDEAAEFRTVTAEVAEGRPEGDVVEQSRIVDEDQFVDRSRNHDHLHETVDEADWLDQSVGENLDDERR